MEMVVKKVEILPLIKHYMQELGLVQLFDKYMPKAKGAELAPAQVLSLMVMNIMVSAKPLYRIEEWLHDYTDGLGEERIEANKYNDDRCARSLDRLFDADRGSMMSELSANAIRVHALECERMHNDTTSVTLKGAYDTEYPDTVKITHGYNKDHRPDCKQVVFGLNVTEDGHVPLSYQLLDGNTADVSTHIPNWTELRGILDKTNFIYVADSKLCAYDNLNTIANQGGYFITVVPRNFKEVKEFIARVSTGETPDWQYSYETPDTRRKGAMQRYLIHIGEKLSSGYRILWVYSESKARLESNQREQRLQKSELELRQLKDRLNQRNLKSRDAIERAIASATNGVKSYFKIDLQEEIRYERVQKGRGRPSSKTQYEEKSFVYYHLDYARLETEIEKAQRTDGLFPLVDNTNLGPVEVLRTYKEQPKLEKRFNTQKSVLEVAPVFLKDPRRIEAMMFLYFVALMLVSLIERRIRREMQEQSIDSLPLRPDGAHTKKPTWRTLVDAFHGVHIATVRQQGQLIYSKLKGLDPLRRQLLCLLNVPIKIYTELTDRWWEFLVPQYG